MNAWPESGARIEEGGSRVEDGGGGQAGATPQPPTSAPPHPRSSILNTATPGAPPSSSAPKPRPRVLIVDDEENILAALRRLLRREPYDLTCASSAAEALRVLEQKSVQLIITDYRMPGLTGTELLKTVQRRWPDIVRIVLSGYSEVKAIITAINEGAIYKFLAKPWNDEEIKLHVRRALELHALEAENRRMAQEIGAQNEELRRLNRLLDQRAADATMGLACTQELLEAIDAGVITIDSDGLIVGANLRASALLSRKNVLIGMNAQTVLPERLWAAACAEAGRALPRADREEAGRAPMAAWGYLACDGRSLQWRVRAVELDGDRRATVITIWEEIPCQPA